MKAILLTACGARRVVEMPENGKPQRRVGFRLERKRRKK